MSIMDESMQPETEEPMDTSEVTITGITVAQAEAQFVPPTVGKGDCMLLLK